MSNVVFAIVITYFPDSAELLKLLRALVPQVARTVLVDNTPGSNLVLDGIPLEFGVIQLRQGANLGIAEALNVGIRYAVSQGCSHVLFSDQDSEPERGLVACLLRAEEDLLASSLGVAAVGPNVFNEVVGTSFRFQLRRGGKRPLSRTAPISEVVSLITSGTLISAGALDRVGLMRPEFFIDFVDTEWCLRAASLGQRCYVVPSSVLRHRMGGPAFRVWLFGWRRIGKYGPPRLYYQFRNSAYLVRLSYVPLAFKLTQLSILATKLYAYCIFSNTRVASLRMMLTGWFDGMRGRLRDPPTI